MNVEWNYIQLLIHLQVFIILHKCFTQVDIEWISWVNVLEIVALLQEALQSLNIVSTLTWSLSAAQKGIN